MEIEKTIKKIILCDRKTQMDSVSATRKGKDLIPMLIFFTHILTMVMVSPEGFVILGSSSAKEISSVLNS